MFFGMEGVFAEQSTFLESTRDVEHEYARFERNGSDSEIRSDIKFHEQHKNGIDVTYGERGIQWSHEIEEPECTENKRIEMYNGFCLNATNIEKAEVFEHDILLLKGPHFDRIVDRKYGERGELNQSGERNDEEEIIEELDRDWVIISSDEELERYVPMKIGDHGIIAGRGQIIAKNNVLCVYSRNKPTMTTSWERLNRRIRMEEFIDLREIRSVPILYNEARTHFGGILRETYNTVYNFINTNINGNVTSINTNNGKVYNFSQYINGNMNFYNSNGMGNMITREGPPIGEGKDTARMTITNHDIKMNNMMTTAEDSVANHNVNVIRNKIVTDAKVTEHDIDVNRETKTTNVKVVDHEVRVENQQLTSNATVMNHDVCIENRLVTTDATVINHDVRVNNTTLVSDVIVTNHGINVVKENQISEVEVTGHDVKINKEVILSNAKVMEHEVEVENVQLASKATVVSHDVQVDNRLAVTNAVVANHEINVIHMNKMSDAMVVGHDVNVERRLMTSNATVTNHEICVDNRTAMTKAVVVNHEVKVEEERLVSEATVTSHDVKVERESQISDVKIVDHDVNINREMKTSNAKVVEHEVKVEKVKKEIVVEIPVFDFKPIFRKVNIQDIVPTNENNGLSIDVGNNTVNGGNSQTGVDDPRMESDAGGTRGSNDDGRSNDDDNDDTEDGDTDYIAELKNDLAGCRNKRDVEDLIRKWKPRKNWNVWNRNEDITKQPLIFIMIRLGYWICPGPFPCQRDCERCFETGNALLGHMKTVHNEKANRDHIVAAINRITSKEVFWKLKWEDESKFRDNVHVCPMPGCKYFTHKLNAWGSHIANSHTVLDTLRVSTGWFWAMLILYARIHNELPSACDILKHRTGYICKRCGIVWSSDAKGLKSHMKRLHGDMNVEGTRIPLVKVECECLINNAIDGSPKNIKIFLIKLSPSLKESNLTIVPMAISISGTNIGANAFQAGESPPMSLINVS